MKTKLLRSNIIPFLVLASALAVPGCGGGGSGGAGASQKPRISLSLSSTDAVQPGDLVTAAVEAHGIGDTFYAAFDLNYDDQVLEFAGAAEGPFLNHGGSDPTAFRAALLDGQPGVVTAGVTRLGGIGPVSGSGTLMTLSFKAVGAGVSKLSFGPPRAIENGGDQEVPVSEWEDGAVTVR